MRILVATDGSRAGCAAVRFASSLLAEGEGDLTVLTVYTAGRGARSEDDGSGTREEAERVLKASARELRPGAAVRFKLAYARGADEVPETISRQADRWNADMVVVGSEGRESLSEWVVGGTALRLIYVARRPVTVVRAPWKRVRRVAIRQPTHR